MKEIKIRLAIIASILGLCGIIAAWIFAPEPCGTIIRGTIVLTMGAVFKFSKFFNS